MRVAVIGGNGQLGSDVCSAFQAAAHEAYPLTHEDLDIVDAAAVRDVLGPLAPDIVVNTAAMHHVERCEEQPEIAFRVNGLGARNVALAGRELGFLLMHISTDYVFDGRKGAPYEEADCPGPLNVYGETKLSGEHFVQSLAPRFLIIRTSGLYGKAPCRAKGLNFVRLMLKLARERGEVRVVTDEIVTPTSTLALARQLVALSGEANSGLIHASTHGSCSWFEFAAAIFDSVGVSVRLLPAVSSDFPAKIQRPAFSVLAKRELERRSADVMPHWREALDDFLQEIGEGAPLDSVRPSGTC
jgi:dTDP-4-dehydrorhamnose reductase